MAVSIPVRRRRARDRWGERSPTSCPRRRAVRARPAHSTFRTEVDCEATLERKVHSEATCQSGSVMSAKLSNVSELRGTPCPERAPVSNGVTVSNVRIAPATTRMVHGNRSIILLVLQTGQL